MTISLDCGSNLDSFHNLIIKTKIKEIYLKIVSNSVKFDPVIEEDVKREFKISK